MKLSTDDYTLVGISMIAAQKFEFAFYGIATHLNELLDAASGPRIRRLTPSDFLSSSPDKRKLRKATLGQIARKFGQRLALPESELEHYVSRRNLIAHDFWREVVSEKGTNAILNHREFLTNFIVDSDKWISAMQGLLSLLIEAAENKEGRKIDSETTTRLMRHRETYYSLVQKHLTERVTPRDTTESRP